MIQYCGAFAMSLFVVVVYFTVATLMAFPFFLCNPGPFTYYYYIGGCTAADLLWLGYLLSMIKSFFEEEEEGGDKKNQARKKKEERKMQMLKETILF